MRDNGWTDSAQAWIDSQGEAGDWARQHVLDRPMMARVAAGSFRHALDVGCGEGRFCRMLAAQGLSAIGIDPVEALIAEARRRDPPGDYRLAAAEDLPFDDASFDLVVSYLSLIDIADYQKAIAEMARVLAPGGSLLIANLTSFSTASTAPDLGWTRNLFRRRVRFAIDHYLEPRAVRVGWRGIRVVNHHRPLAAYVQALLGQGLALRWFDEPHANPAGGPERAALFDRVPYAFVMEWQRPAQ